MPLNPLGEFIPELGFEYRVSPASKWQNTPFLDTAAQHAAAVFAAEGALHPIRFMPDDVLIQEYPKLGKLLFLFQLKIRGEEKIVQYTFEIPPETAAQLTLMGMWGDVTPTQH